MSILRITPRLGWRAFIAGVACTTALSLSTTHAAAAQSPGSGAPAIAATHGVFRFASAARGALHRLWDESMEAKQERVACLGGYVDHAVVHITRIRRLTGAPADSMNVNALQSLHDCGAPEWLGTVHTHIATQGGQPYSVFSGSDRMVMQMWRQEWKTEGVFCILYSESEANCEAGEDLAERVAYGNARGNSIVP